jgi:hypothetical protein
MNRENRYAAYIGLLLGLLLPLLLMALAGCSTVSLSRTDAGVTLEYSTFLTKIQAPQVQVEKVGDYSASFNAESKGSDLEVMRDIIELATGVKQP